MAVRRLHRQFGHPAPRTLESLLRSAKIAKVYIEALKLHRCPDCENSAPKKPTHKTMLPHRYKFNHTLGIDLFDVSDAKGDKCLVQNMLCCGTTFQQVKALRKGKGQASSAECLRALDERWFAWAGHPSELVSDRGLHNRGVLAKYMSANGIQVFHAPLQTPEAIGRVERHGGIIKAMYRRVCSETQPVGIDQVNQVLTQCCRIKNSMHRVGGYSPSQRVLGTCPRGAPSFMDEEGWTDLGAIGDRIDPDSIFALQHKARMEAKKAFVELDCSKRVQRALLRNAQPIYENYEVGDIVCFRRDFMGKTQWSPASRVIGKEGDKKVWVLCENTPVLVDGRNLRPANDAEALGRLILHGHDIVPEEIIKEHGQQAFEDASQVPVPEGEVPSDPEPEETEGSGLPRIPEHGLLEDEDEPMRAARTRDAEIAGRNVRPRVERTSPVLEPDPERGTIGSEPQSRRTSAQLVDDLPDSIRSHFERQQSASSEEASMTANVAYGHVHVNREKYVAFIADRVSETENAQRNKNAVQERLLVYDEASEEVQRALTEARAAEWEKFQKFGAAVPIDGEELRGLLDAGHVAIPSRWVEVDKNDFQRGQPGYKPKYKSRLVICGNFEDREGLRGDAPTGDVEAHHIVCAWAAAHQVAVKSCDITSAYFQARELLLMRQPRGGLPDVSPTAYLLVRKPVYGLTDSGRGFWLQVSTDAAACGLTSSRIVPAFYYHVADGRVDAVMTTHVDDFLYAHTETGRVTIENLLSKFVVGSSEEGNFRYCGKRINQEKDSSIKIDVDDNTRKLSMIKIEVGRKLTDAVNPLELSQLRSVVGSLSWIARQGRPDLLYRTSRLQSLTKAATVATLKEANKTVELALEGIGSSLYFHAGRLDWQNVGILTVTDASFAHEENHKSQQGRFHFLVSSEQARDQNCETFDVVPLGFASSAIKRVCRATMQAETYALQNGIESGDKLRAVICETQGRLQNLTGWYETIKKYVPHTYLSDCRSLVSHLKTEVPPKIADKRLSIEMAAIRQSLWNEDGTRTAVSFPEGGDRIRWIATATMVADCFTKPMKADFMWKVINTGVYVVETDPNEKS